MILIFTQKEVEKLKYKTEGKQLVLHFFEERSDSSFSCSEVYTSLSDYGVGKSSVFRIISDFEKEGKIKRVPSAEGKGALYRFASCGSCSEHLHLKCQSCGKLIHLDRVTTGAVEASLLINSGFSLDEHTPLLGKCKSCKNR